MARSRRLVASYLENISGDVFEEYTGAIRELIKGQSGIYALYRRGSIYYVGLARNLMGRIRQHQRDHHDGYWDRFSVFLTSHDEHMKELESLLLRIVHPVGNKQKGRFANALNFNATLNKLVKATDTSHRESLIGGRQRSRKALGRGKRGGKSLQGLVRRSKALRGIHGDWQYQAKLLRSGEIQFGRSRFDSPTAAASAAIGKRCNGWKFWTYRDARGDWVPIGELLRGKS